MGNWFKSDRETDDSNESSGFGMFPDHQCANSPDDITERECLKSE